MIDGYTAKCSKVREMSGVYKKRRNFDDSSPEIALVNIAAVCKASFMFTKFFYISMLAYIN